MHANRCLWSENLLHSEEHVLAVVKLKLCEIKRLGRLTLPGLECGELRNKWGEKNVRIVIIVL